MSTPEAKASGIQLDGATKVIPGFETGTYKGDQLPFFIGSGLIDLTSAAANQGSFMVPFAATIVKVMLNVLVLPGTAAATVVVGTSADADHFVADYSVATNTSTGLVDITSDATVVNTSIDAGDVIEFSTDGGATGTGSAIVTLVVVPTN